jgi:glycosyltransferase involved in cell wall biosynthesis
MNSFSVVIPVYNGAQYLAETIRSCLTQSAQFDEIIVLDDASNDDTFEIAKGAIAEADHVALHQLDTRVTAQDNGDSETAFMTLHEWAPFLDERQRRDIVRGIQDFNENIVSAQIRDRSIAAMEVVALRKAIGLKMRRWQTAGLPQSMYVKRYPRSWARMLVWLLSVKAARIAAIRWALLQHARLTSSRSRTAAL